MICKSTKKKKAPMAIDAVKGNRLYTFKNILFIVYHILLKSIQIVLS